MVSSWPFSAACKSCVFICVLLEGKISALHIGQFGLFLIAVESASLSNAWLHFVIVIFFGVSNSRVIGHVDLDLIALTAVSIWFLV